MSGHAQPLAERSVSHRGRGADMVHPPDSTEQSRFCGAGEQPAERTLPQHNLITAKECTHLYGADGSHFIFSLAMLNCLVYPFTCTKHFVCAFVGNCTFYHVPGCHEYSFVHYVLYYVEFALFQL